MKYVLLCFLAAAVYAATSTNEPTVVTSDRMQADYASNVGTFDGNVLAVDPRITVRANKMVVFFGTVTNVTAGATNATRQVQRIVATGSATALSLARATAAGPTRTPDRRGARAARGRSCPHRPR